jgi:hypothetical protein
MIVRAHLKFKREPVLKAEYKAQLRQADGSEVQALFRCFDDSMVNLDQQCRLVLKFEREELTATANDFFAALDKVRQQLEPRGIVPLVNGANRTNYPSGMARDMGMGFSVYRLRLGKQMGDMADLVKTFEANAVDQVSTVKEQREFFEQWLRSFPE